MPDSWSFAGGPRPARESRPPPASAPVPDPDPFDPVEHTITEVKQFVTDYPEARDQIYALEQASEKPRSTLLDWLAS